MRITVDPIELMTTAVTMGTAAVELADIGTSLQSCVGCAMPADIRNMIDQIVATTDGVLDASASLLRTEAGDLAQRALIATNDSLAAASLATTPPNIGVIGGNAGAPFTITNIDGSPANPKPTTATIGGNSFGQPVLVSATGSSAVTGMSVVGGSWTPGLEITITNPDGSPSGFSTAQLDEALRKFGPRAPRANAGNDLGNRMAIQGSLDFTNRTAMNNIGYDVMASNSLFPIPPQYETRFSNG